MIKSILGGKSKNLCDFAYLLTLPLDKTFESQGFWRVLINAKPDTTYTFSRENANQITDFGIAYLAISAYDDISHNNWLSHPDVPDLNNKSATLTTGSEGKLWILFNNFFYKDYWQKNINPFGYIQLELGSTATEYVPHELTSYKSIMKVSDVCQLVDPKYMHNIVDRGVTFTSNGDGSITVNGTPTGEYYSVGTIVLNIESIKPNHKYVVYDVNKDPIISELIIANYQGGYIYKGIGNIFTFPEHHYTRFVFEIQVNLNQTANNMVVHPQLIDLTEMFGAGNEPKTVAEFKAKFPNDYYPYSPSCFVTSFDERMPCKTKNLFDINAEMHNADKPNYYIEVMGNIVKTNYDISHTVHPYIEIPVEIWETYTFSCNVYRSSNIINVYGRVRYPDNTVVAYIGNGPQKKTFTATQSSIQVCFGIDTHGSSDTSQFAFIYDIQLVKGTTATDYVPYGYV